MGGIDVPVISTNKLALEKLVSVKEMQIVYGATPLFEEPGKLDEVASLAINWYKKYLVKPKTTQKAKASK